MIEFKLIDYLIKFKKISVFIVPLQMDTVMQDD